MTTLTKYTKTIITNSTTTDTATTLTPTLTLLYSGELRDPYHEFMVCEDSSVSKESLEQDFNAQFWDNHYTLHHSHVPQLFSTVAAKALIAGKYLNVVINCATNGILNATATTTTHHNGNNTTSGLAGSSAIGSKIGLYASSHGKSTSEIHFELPVERTISLSVDGVNDSISAAIEEAYLYSSRALLKLLEMGHDLSSHLRSISRFFLLEHGDFFIQFMDSAEDELRKEVGDVSIARIQSLLQLAVQSSSTALTFELHADELSCSLASHNLIQHLYLIQVGCCCSS